MAMAARVELLWVLPTACPIPSPSEAMRTRRHIRTSLKRGPGCGRRCCSALRIDSPDDARTLRRDRDPRLRATRAQRVNAPRPQAPARELIQWERSASASTSGLTPTFKGGSPFSTKRDSGFSWCLTRRPMRSRVPDQRLAVAVPRGTTRSTSSAVRPSEIGRARRTHRTPSSACRSRVRR
jgi:hypothetical protein